MDKDDAYLPDEEYERKCLLKELVEDGYYDPFRIDQADVAELMKLKNIISKEDAYSHNFTKEDEKRLALSLQVLQKIEVRQSIEKYTRNKVANEYLKFEFHPIDEKEICEVMIEPSPRPVFIYDEGGKQQECYVRVGNSSKPYTLDEFYEYARRRFK